MSVFMRLAVGMVAVCLALSAGAAELQWGFDFTSDLVSNQNGGIVDNDGTGGANLNGQVWDDDPVPLYTNDIPPALWMQNTTGIGSVDIRSSSGDAGGHLRSVGTTSDLGDSTALWAAGGLTMEVWVKHTQFNTGGDDYPMTVGDWFSLHDSGDASGQGGSDFAGSRYKIIMNSSSRPTASWPRSNEEKIASGWTHLAGVLITGAGDNNTVQLYIDGILRSEKTGLLDNDVNVIDIVAGRSITAGNGHNFNGAGSRFQGLVYEPRVTMGALDPSQFTANTADSDTDGLVDLWEYKTFTNLTFTTGAADVDGDGLSNQQEQDLGTNPLDPDTDGDGLADGVESGTGAYVGPADTGTHPMDADFDNDGVIDGAEIDVYGSDPFEFDVDLDLAPDIVELTVGTDPNNIFDDPSFIYNLLWADMPVGDDWNDSSGFYFTFGTAGADTLWVVGGSQPDYGEVLRSPEGAGTSYPSTFPLILSGAGATLRLKQDDGETATVDDLRLRGGTVDNGNGGQTLVLDGAITVERSTLTNLAELVISGGTPSVTYWAEGASTLDTLSSDRGLVIDASLAGDQGLTARGAGSVDIRSLDNAFSGGWSVLEGTLLKARGLNSLGTGDIYLENGTLDADYNLALMDSTLTVVDPASGLGGGVLVVDKEHYVGALEAGSTSIPAGTYTATQLVALAGASFTNSFVDGGGTVTVTGIGLGDADGNGIPDVWEVLHYGSNGQDPADDTDDSDGLPIGQEFAAGTDPKDPDSDGDTLNDGPEVFTHGTDPTKDDTDGDTLLDGGELVGVGSRPPTDPLDADTDGDTLDDRVESNTRVFVDADDTGTDPTSVDTDADLFSDDAEVEAGSDPNDPNSVPSGFFDDFEAYPTSDPADFTATPTNWFWNGLGTAPNASRIFDTGNFGGTRLWIASAGNAAAGTGIDSRGIVVDPNKLYAFEGALVCETGGGNRTATFTVDLLTGPDAGSASSVVGGPVTVIARGDDDGSPGADNTYTDQVTRIDFNTVGMAPADLLFIKIAAVGTDASNPFIGVDNIGIVEVPDADGDLLPDDWEIEHYVDIYLYDGNDDPDGDLLNNSGELLRGTDPLDPDSDDDGLTDKVETDTGIYVSPSDTGTDPLDPDSDGDGLEDGDEIAAGTDPLDPDSDTDGFSDGAELAAGSDPTSPASVPAWCSNAFEVSYDAISDVPSVEGAADGWEEVDNAAAGAGILWATGYLFMDSIDPSTNQSTAGGMWVQSEPDNGGAWDGNNPGSFSVEVKTRILEDAGAFGLNIWAGRAGNAGTALANITTDAVFWGASRDMYLTDTNGIDNTTDFHVYRVLYDAGLSAFSVYRDNVLLANGLGAPLGNDDRLIVGDIGGAGAVKAEVDYIRFEAGLPWGPDAPTDDCDGDGLLNNEEDINGNGSQDPGETDAGDADSDGDGSDDGDEVLVTGTDPLDANSVFEVVDATLLPGGTVEWSSVPGKTYRVQYTDAMDPTNWTDLVPDQPASGTGTTSYTDPAAAGIERYYRVIVLFP